MPKATIQTGPQLHAIERRAVDELRRYIRTLFGFTPAVSSGSAGGGYVIAVGTGVSNPHLAETRRLGEQDYAIRRPSPKRLEVCGGSPAAVLWGVYEVVEQWGVTYLIQGDVLPDPKKVGPFGLPRLNAVRRPLFELRLSRIFGDMLNTHQWASLAEHEKLLTQLSKLRFNAVLDGSTEIAPWCHWSFRGVERTRTAMGYGIRHPIDRCSIGQEVIGQLGDYEHPDMIGAETYEEKLAAGKRLMHGVIAAAHQRGIKVMAGRCVNDIPEELSSQLPRWSRKYRIPRSTMGRNNVIGLGLQIDRCSYRFGHLMTPLNPAYVELVETMIATQLAEYPELDGMCIWQSEWPPGAGGIEKCWQQLDRRYGLSPRYTYDKLMRTAARETITGSTDRSVHEAKAAVVSIRLLDLLLNERDVITNALGPDTKLYTGFIGQTLNPVLPEVFGQDQIEFVANLDYLTSDVAKSMSKLEFVKDTDYHFHLCMTINDDNIGFLPQYNTKPLHNSLRAMQKYGVKGYWFRLYETTEYEAVIAHIAAAAWDRSRTITQSYTRQVERICGRDAVKPMLRGYRMLEATLPQVDQLMGIGFMLPGLMRGFWSQHGKPKIWQQLIDTYPAIEKQFEAAAEASEPRGKRFAADMAAFVRFGRLYLISVQHIRDARIAYDAAQDLRPKPKTRKRFDLDAYSANLSEAVANLDDAVAMLEQAIRVWASTVRDATDRGSLVGLNTYGLDWLRGKAVEVRLESSLWSLNAP